MLKLFLKNYLLFGLNFFNLSVGKDVLNWFQSSNTEIGEQVATSKNDEHPATDVVDVLVLRWIDHVSHDYAADVNKDLVEYLVIVAILKWLGNDKVTQVHKAQYREGHTLEVRKLSQEHETQSRQEPSNNEEYSVENPGIWANVVAFQEYSYLVLNWAFLQDLVVI